MKKSSAASATEKKTGAEQPLPTKTVSPGHSDLLRRQILADMCRFWGDRLMGVSIGGIRRSAKGEGTSAVKLLSAATSRMPSPVSGESGHVPAKVAMSPRLRQTLDLLLAGDGEKQIAGKLGLSRHTEHDYVKGVYRLFGVNTRAELLARWVRK